MKPHEVLAEIKIHIPATLNSFQSMKFSCYVAKVPLARKYIFDFSFMKMVVPFGALVVAKTISQFIQRTSSSTDTLGFTPEYVATGIDVHNNSSHGYAAHIGFYKFFKCDIGREVAEATGSMAYVPIRFINVAAVHEQATESRQHYGYVVEEASSQLAKFLVRSKNDDVVDLLTYSIREMMRNVIEHSGAEHIWYCGQYYPSMKKVDIAILDEGVGIHDTLSRNKDLEIGSNLQSLQLALSPGVSRVSQRKKRFSDDDEWANSGYGLYATSKLCRKCGNFLLLSKGDSILVGEDDVKCYKAGYGGTAVHISVSLERVANFKTSLSAIIKEGSALAKKSAIPSNPTASMISRMLKASY